LQQQKTPTPRPPQAARGGVFGILPVDSSAKNTAQTGLSRKLWSINLDKRLKNAKIT
jgi:hypothetical protein